LTFAFHDVEWFVKGVVMRYLVILLLLLPYWMPSGELYYNYYGVGSTFSQFMLSYEEVKSEIYWAEYYDLVFEEKTLIFD